jgi:hypothetical protein
VWFGLVWFGLVWFGLVWFGLVWFGLVWFGLVWFGLVWFGVAAAQGVSKAEAAFFKRTGFLLKPVPLDPAAVPAHAPQS